MGKNILEQLLAEYDQNIDRILKKHDEEDWLGEIAGAFTSLSCKECLRSDLKQ